MGQPQDIEALTIQEVINRIRSFNHDLCRFWSSAEGWAPLEAAHLLSKSRLDWQVSLSSSLSIWFEDCANEQETARLILGWANIGSLIEGSLKLFLSVFYEDYRDDINARLLKNGKLKDPDSLMLEELRMFVVKSVWVDEKWDDWIRGVQARRNSIHAYRNRDLGSLKDLEDSVRTYLSFLHDLCARLPYPWD